MGIESEQLHRKTLTVIALAAAAGAFVGALAAAGVVAGLNALGEDSLTAEERLQAIEETFVREWPRFESGGDWLEGLYNSHEELEREFTYELSGLIEERGIDFARDRVEDWRRRYARWVEWVSELLGDLSAFSGNYESVETVHFRGKLVLEHIDALLGR